MDGFHGGISKVCPKFENGANGSNPVIEHKLASIFTKASEKSKKSLCNYKGAKKAPLMKAGLFAFVPKGTKRD